MLFFVDWSGLSDKCIMDRTCDIAQVFFKQPVALFSLYLVWHVLQLVNDILSLRHIASFFEFALEITDK